MYGSWESGGGDGKRDLSRTAPDSAEESPNQLNWDDHHPVWGEDMTSSHSDFILLKIVCSRTKQHLKWSSFGLIICNNQFYRDSQTSSFERPVILGLGAALLIVSSDILYAESVSLLHQLSTALKDAKLQIATEKISKSMWKVESGVHTKEVADFWFCSSKQTSRP